jgi:hypothetical protein
LTVHQTMININGRQITTGKNLLALPRLTDNQPGLLKFYCG